MHFPHRSGHGQTIESESGGSRGCRGTDIRPLLDDVVFVGGQVAELLITEPQAVRVRPTVDVDVVVSAASRLEYHRMGERLREFDGLNYSMKLVLNQTRFVSESVIMCRHCWPTLISSTLLKALFPTQPYPRLLEQWSARSL